MRRENLLKKSLMVLGFPGGHIDKGEHIETALNREILEEMGEGNPVILEKDWSCQYSPIFIVKKLIELRFWN